MKSKTKFVLYSLLLLFATTAAARDPVSGGARLIGERPNAAGDPTDIHVNLFLVDIDAVDDARQRFSVDLFVNISWQDPRLALPDDGRSGQIRIVPLDTIWTPRALIVNDRGISPRLPMVVEIDDLGNVQHRQRYFGELGVELDLHDFPFDTQQLSIDIVSYQYSPAEVRFLPRILSDLDQRRFSAVGWNFRVLEPELGELVIPAAGISRPQLTFAVEGKRNIRYYLFTMFLPVSLIIFMSWTAFWLQPDLVPSRVAISTASIFSLIAFSFSIRLGLPEISYMTRADVFVTGSMLLVFVALGASVLGSRYASANNMARALRINSVARWLYLALFGGVAFVAVAV